MFSMRHASVTFDPAASACDMPALLLTQRPRHATCRRGPFFILMSCARFHHVICATEILSDCEGKVPQVNDACQYVMLPIFHRVKRGQKAPLLAPLTAICQRYSRANALLQHFLAQHFFADCFSRNKGGLSCTWPSLAGVPDAP